MGREGKGERARGKKSSRWNLLPFGKVSSIPKGNTKFYLPMMRKFYNSTYIYIGETSWDIIILIDKAQPLEGLPAIGARPLN